MAKPLPPPRPTAELVAIIREQNRQIAWLDEALRRRKERIIAAAESLKAQDNGS